MGVDIVTSLIVETRPPQTPFQRFTRITKPGTMYNTVFAYTKDDDVVSVPSARGLQSALASVKKNGVYGMIYFSVTCAPLPSVGRTVEL